MACIYKVMLGIVVSAFWIGTIKSIKKWYEILYIIQYSQMTSCKNRQYLPPSLPSVMVRHYCLDPPKPKMTSSWSDPPFELFQFFMRIIIFISL